MLVTKHAAELCALLVLDLHGELPSRILTALLTRGRCTTSQLAQHTTLTPKQLRNGLAVLFQQNLLYTRIDNDARTIHYDANPDACYNLVRSGKILEFIEEQFGTSERDLVQTLLQLGHAKINDLGQAFSARNPFANGAGHGANGTTNGVITSEDGLLIGLGRLIQAGFVETVRPESFRNPVDIFHEIRNEATKTEPGGKSAKSKYEQHEAMVNGWRKFREQSKTVKRQLDQTRGIPSKRRKLTNGKAANGDLDDEEVPNLNPNIIVRVNHEKCLVELRNLHLAEVASDALGDATSEVYRTLLQLMTVETPMCRKDTFVDDDVPLPTAVVTTLDILEHLDESVNLSSGIGKISKSKLNQSSVEKIKATAPQSDDESDESEDDAGGAVSLDADDESDEENDEDVGLNGEAQTNGNRATRVTFQDDAPQVSRLDQMRQHLLLLKESKYKFVRHCGTQGRGQWTVDFDQLMNRVRETELDAVIESKYGRHGLRLTRILREKGKLDEKMLHGAALMKKPDVQAKMVQMQMAGVVDIQEVPKDSSRLANRTMFFWYYDAERMQAQMLDDVYKAMVRCLQTLQVRRYHEKSILSFVERKDVQGREEEVMTTEHYNTYNRHLEVEEKLLGQVMRLDSMISVLRDF